ncbi:helix-turn-helix domain-containing protein [Roseibium sp.]|uniref:AraC family transcriptional regulator n=1 Tax=Roseibium sp. TaxID=1936156 RepID=UPI003A982BB6
MPLDDKTDWVVSSLLINAGALAREKGINWGHILEKHNVAASLLLSPDKHVGLRQTLEILNTLSHSVSDPTFILNGFANLPIGVADLLDYVAVFAPDAGTALQNWARYAPLCSKGMTVSVEQSASGLELELSIPVRFGSNAQASYALMGLMANRLGYILGPESKHTQVQFTSVNPGNAAFPLRLGGFSGQVQFETCRNRILLPDRVANIPNPHADKNLLRLIHTAATRLLADVQEDESTISMISAKISEGLREGRLSMEAVSSSLGLSQRSLQRLLEQEGTSYREILDDVRKSSAERYLLDTRLAAKEIAYLLGFSNISAFSRAVKNWFGMAPRDLRKHALEDMEAE